VVCKRTLREDRLPQSAWEYPLKWGGMLGKTDVGTGCYVKGRLQPTRSFGDYYLKYEKLSFDQENNRHLVQKPHSFPYISAAPIVSVFKRQPTDNFIVLGTDGLWDFLSDQQVVDIVSGAVARSPVAACESLLQAVLSEAASQSGLNVARMKDLPPSERRRCYDDATVIVLPLN